MNPQTAETLLRCYRPGKPADSKTEKAMRLAEEDPELGKILRAQIEFDEQIIDAIHFIKPPDNLRQKLSDLSVKPEKTRLGKQVINPAVLTALLGIIVILGIVVFFVFERIDKFPGREAVENMLNSAGKMSGTELETVSTTAGQAGDWFYMRGYDGFEAPAELTELPVIGSRVFRIDGRTVAQILIGTGDQVKVNPPCLIFQFHASEFGVQLPPDGDWKVVTEDDWAGAIRQHGDHCFLVTFRGTKVEMQDFLRSLHKKP